METEGSISKMQSTILGLMLLLCLIFSLEAGIKIPSTPLKLDVEDYFESSGWMGDGVEKPQKFNMPTLHKENPHSKPFCVKVSYPTFGKKKWGGVYWQYPVHNWGQKPGYDLSGVGYNSITFWARGEKGGELVEFKGGDIDKTKNDEMKYKDSFWATAGKIFLTKQWTKYYIDLRGKDLSSVIGGFCWNTSEGWNPNGLVFYIDDIMFTKEEPPPLDCFDIGLRFVPSGSMKESEDTQTPKIQLSEACRENPNSTPACIKIVCRDFGTQVWAGMYWLNRENNWGEKPGYDLSKTGYNSITFWVRGEKGDEDIEFKAGGIKNTENKKAPTQYKDSIETTLPMKVKLSKEWTEYSLDLQGQDLSSVIGGFCWTVKQRRNPDGVVFYLDDICFKKK